MQERCPSGLQCLGEAQGPKVRKLAACATPESIAEVGIQGSPAIAAQNCLLPYRLCAVWAALHFLTKHSPDMRHRVVDADDQQHDDENIEEPDCHSNRSPNSVADISRKRSCYKY